MRRVPLSLLRAVLTVALVSPVGALSAESTKLPPAITRSVDFERDVQPIFAQSCLECHGPKKQKSDFRIDVKKISLAGGVSGKPAIVPGKSADSPLIRFVAGLEDDMQMPPSGKGDPLTAEQIGILRAWIDQGAVWPEHASAQVADATDWWSTDGAAPRQCSAPAAGFDAANPSNSAKYPLGTTAATAAACCAACLSDPTCVAGYVFSTDAGASLDVGVAADAGPLPRAVSSSNGCGCVVAGRAPSGASGLGGLVALAAFLRRRRR